MYVDPVCPRIQEIPIIHGTSCYVMRLRCEDVWKSKQYFELQGCRNFRRRRKLTICERLKELNKRYMRKRYPTSSGPRITAVIYYIVRGYRYPRFDSRLATVSSFVRRRRISCTEILLMRSYMDGRSDVTAVVR